MGIIRRSWLTRASGGNLARTPGLHPTLYEKCHGIFNDTEIQDLGLTSYPKDKIKRLLDNKNICRQFLIVDNVD